MTNLVVQNVSLVGNSRYNVSFSGDPDGTIVPGTYPMATTLTLNLSEEDARAYFPGDVYELTLTKQ